MLRPTLLVLLLVLTGATAARAQTDSIAAAPAVPGARGGALSGRVADAAGAPVPDASVALTELRRGTLTAADGRYTIASVPPGVYHVSVQRLGYAPVLRRIVLADGPATLDVRLTESLIELPSTQITATANPTTALTSPQPVGVLEGEALRQARAPSLGATIEQLPGVRSWSSGTGIGKPSIRGLRSDRVVIAANDMRLENQNWGDEHGPQVEPADIERIEVIRGPASVLYGSDALGGVVNVIPRGLPTAFGRAPFMTGRLHGGYGSADGNREGGIAFEGAAQGFGGRGSFTARRSDDIATPAGELFNSGNRATTGSGALGLRGARGSVDVSFTHRGERVEIHEDPAEDPDATPYQEIRDDLGRLAAILPLGGASRVEVILGMERNRRSEFESAGDTEVAVGLLARTFGGVAHLHHAPVGPFEGLVGVSHQHHRFTKFGEESLIPASTASDAALFLFEHSETGPWRFAFGARYDHRTLEVEDDADLGTVAQQRSWDAVTGNVGVLYRAAEPVAVVANFGRGFRAPSNFDLFASGVHEGTVAFERGNPDLGVETSLNGDLAVRVQTSRVSLEAGGFVNVVRNYIYSRPTGTFDPGSGFEIFETVQGDARLAGFEVVLDAHPERHIHLSASSDFVRGDNTDTDTPLPWIPPLRAVVGVRFEPDPFGAADEVYLGLRAESLARQTRVAPFDTGVPAYTLLHAEAGGRLVAGSRSVALDLAVRNLADRAYRDFMSRFKTWALAPGRGFTARLTVAF